jgi:alkanesulfonate monooxygenase SsuD/methylene tetrahydromethanopterin reductase-like flavin-dependent oxidoreductase (luciferase family)
MVRPVLARQPVDQVGPVFKKLNAETKEGRYEHTATGTHGHPGAGWRASDVRNVAQEAEAAGFDAIFTTEVNNDALATAQLMGSATTHIQIGTWIANIYLRHPYTCAKGASLIADDTGGRFVLGLGVSHQPVNDALAIDMSNAPADLHRYVIEVRNWLDGNGPATHLPRQGSL